MSIVDFIESLRDDITSSEISSKEVALSRLSIYLSRLSSSEPNTDSVNCLTTFYENILCEHYQLLPAIIDGISTLIDFDHFNEINAKTITNALVKLDVPQLKPQIRRKIYGLLDQLLTSFLNTLKSSGDGFINDFLNCIYGENSPECVESVLRICLIIIEHFNIAGVYQELFESVAVYFPVEVKKTKNTSSKVTKEQLAELNKKCLIGSAMFGPQLLPILLEKATADKKSARIDSLDILVDGLGVMNFDDVFNYHMSFFDCFLYQFKNRDSECQILSLKCVESLAGTFENHASEAQLIEFCWHLYEITNGIIIENDKKLLQFLLSAVTGNNRVWCGVMANFMSPLMEKLLKLEFEDIDKLEIFGDLLSTGENLPKYRGLLDSSKANEFFTKLNSIYMETLNCPNTIENNEKLWIIFNLLAHYSLFNLWIPKNVDIANYDADVMPIMESRCRLLSTSMTYLANNTNMKLENVILKLTPKLLESSISLTNLRNNFTELVISYAQKEDSLQNLGFRLLESLPVCCLELVLPIIDLKLRDIPAVATAASCLAILSKRFSNDPEATDLLCLFFLTILGDLIVEQSMLSDEAVSNIALVLSELGTPVNESWKSKIIDELLRASKASDFPEPSVMWLCSLLGHSSIPSTAIKSHFCDELKLFPKQSLFYEQQSFHLVAQPFRTLAIEDSTTDCVKDVSMEIYLKLVSSYPQHVLDMYIDEIVETVGQWFKKLVDNNSKTSLRIEALKSVCTLKSSVTHLDRYAEDIARNIIATGNSISLLGVRDRYFLAVAIGWFLVSFLNHRPDEFMTNIKIILRKLVDDKTRIVRMEAAKCKTILFL